MAEAITRYVACRPIVIATGTWDAAELREIDAGTVFDSRGLTEDDADDYLHAGIIRPASNYALS